MAQFNDIVSAEREIVRPIDQLVGPIRALPSEHRKLGRIRSELLAKMHDIDDATAAHGERVGEALQAVLTPHLGHAAATWKFAGEFHDIGKFEPEVNRLVHAPDFYPDGSLEKQVIMLHEPIGFQTLGEVAILMRDDGNNEETRTVITAALAAEGSLKPGSDALDTLGEDRPELEFAGAALHWVDVADALISKGEERRYRSARQLANGESGMTEIQIMEEMLAREYGGERKLLPHSFISPEELAIQCLRSVATLHYRQNSAARLAAA